ncbi:hypothetical protein L593_04055 [Salinarchaeum sp. Harcht-Bsk1]|uniref:GNAT family N-acetyltransferase n=1 Tax=Salinarchaeum sp. Harcht-Bsk1 TaxID=1333523 RepID=UPI000342378C|nr:GNAT family N-acetyltransferase [Salinarchaeum sp. Harcht-Bsk1]AGN00762.1 hypothetical protein L593_04055 [Salinarchaeum sp. Harcht-Bsk1]
MADYRPVTDDRRARYHAIMQQAFDAESGPAPSYADGDADEDPEDWPPDLSDPRGLVADDEVVSTCKLYYLDATVRGEWTEIGGLGGVATPPEHRRKGYSRETLQGALTEYREQGVDLVALWPSTVRFYRGLGWGVANRTQRARVPPAQLVEIEGPEPAGGDDGRFRQLDADDWERLRSVEVERAQRFGLSLRRTEEWWRTRTLAAWPSGPGPYVYGDEVDGDLRGYVLTHVREGEDGKELKVQDLAGVDHAAERTLLGFLANYDSQVETVVLDGPLAGDLPELVPDPGELDVTESVGTMIRLTDVQRWLEGYEWPASVEDRFVLDVADPLLDRNADQFLVHVADGEATVESAGGDLAGDATLGIGTLSRLAIGAIDVDRAERLRDLQVHDDASRETLETAFPAEPVYLREFF